MNMALIEFELKSIKEIVPWGEGAGRLSWFGLTDGFYYLNTGIDQLFRYSNQIIDYWKHLYPDDVTVSHPYVDYQITRLYEDLIEILPNVLQPIPKELHSLVITQAKEDSWRKYWRDMLDLVDDEDEKTIDQFIHAQSWWNHRQLSSYHIVEGPTIAMWRFENEIFIRWDNQSRTINNIPVWSSQMGEVNMSVDEFISEIKSFNDRFLSAMCDRVNEIVHANPIHDVDIDIEHLIKEQSEREGWLANALKISALAGSDYWESILNTNHELHLL
jgi:Family of unknown function (DUF5984)